MKDSIVKTYAVAAGLCIVCSLLVSFTAVTLKPIQQKNALLDKQINVLKAAGLVGPKDSPNAKTVEELFQKVEQTVIDLETGDVLKDVDPKNIDVQKLMKDPATRTELTKMTDKAGIRFAPKKAVVYLIKDEKGQLQSVVFPIFGRGLWSTMYGFMALKGDLKTVANINFYAHAETPGLGGEIANPNWTSKWVDKLALDDAGKPVIRIIKGAVDPKSSSAASQVDGISGATLTGNGVNNTVEFWLGENGFAPYLKKLRAQNNIN